MRLAVVTASTNPEKTRQYWQTWFDNKELDETAVVVVVNGGFPVERIAEIQREPEGKRPIFCTRSEYGVVPNFFTGVSVAEKIFEPSHILCLHDDVSIETIGWDQWLLEELEKLGGNHYFGFGGALSLGRLGMYDEAYDPMSLARGGFLSNMRDAEAHGTKRMTPTRVACLDGFSLGGPAGWMVEMFDALNALGIIHHAYDAAFGAFAARWKREIWMLPMECHHAGGQTAVLDSGYHEWASKQVPGGDQGFWQAAHRIVWEEFKDVLPISVTW